ncbi:MAG: c-type cytochrome [Candidatus Solibacter usitatus]|nr:c-type cytochrome [Candidatus Solibacter usitatus]
MLWTFVTIVLAATLADAQQPPAQPAPPPAAVRRRAPDFPQRPAADQAIVDRGKAVYGVYCTFCHGADARGGSGGPNLIRTAVVLNDQNGELIGKVVREGREGMPRLDLTNAQISDIAAFVHSFRVGGYDVSRMTPPTILTGDAKAGQVYFEKTCAGCHSVNGNLKGIGTRIGDPKQLQQSWLMPGGGGRRGPGGPGGGGGGSRIPPTTVTVTTAGAKVEGVLTRIDDFFVSLTDKEGTPRTFTREGDKPKVEIHDPLEGHRKLIPTYKDKDIHNVTAYLVTVK